MQAQDRKVDLRREKIILPAVFIGHGSPMLAIEYDNVSEQLCQFIDNIPRPSAIVIISAHWQTEDEIRITANEFPEQLYDFSDLPETLNMLTYPCEGNPQLAENIAYLLSDMNYKIVLDDQAGLDHGVWIPLYVSYPDADIPIVQISLPKAASPKDLLDIGHALCNLREKGVLLVGSGNLICDKSLMNFKDKYDKPDNWAIEVDQWFRQHLKDIDIRQLLDYANFVPHADKLMSTKEHILPLFFALGAIRQKDHFVSIVEGFHYRNMSMRSFAFVSNQ